MKKKAPTIKIDFLLAAIAIYFLVIFIATWQAFSIARAKVNDSTGKLTLSWKADKPLISANAIMYEFIAAGFVCLVLFFLLELNPNGFTKSNTNSIESVTIMRQPIQIGVQAEEVKELWGQPFKQNSDSNVWLYQSKNSNISIFFNQGDVVTKITTELRKENDQ